jgi:hypothetical protein
MCFRLFDLLLLILKRKSVVRITTGSQALDELLGGNICRPWFCSAYFDVLL